MNRTLPLIVLALLIGLVAPVSAQVDLRRETVENRDSRAGEIDRKLRAARRLMSNGDYLPASEILESVYATDPSHEVTYNLLKTCYLVLKYFHKMEALAQRFAERFPDNTSYRLDLAQALAYQSRRDEALTEFRAILAAARQPGMYRAVFENMLAVHLEEEALTIIDSLSGVAFEPHEVAVQRGRILERQQRYREAVLAYFSVLDDTTRRASDAERRLLSLLEREESSSKAEQALLELVAEEASLRAIRTLADFYLKSDRFEEAFAFTLKLDSLEAEPGWPAQRFLRACYERELWEQAAEVADYILTTYGGGESGPLLIQTYFMYADVLVQLDRAPEAITYYDSIYTIVPRTQEKAEALYNIGAIYMNNLRDYDRALLYFDSVVEHHSHGSGFLLSRLAVPFCYLRPGKLEQARGQFEKLTRARLNEDHAEMVDYYLAALRLCEKQYDSARVALRKLLVDYPKGYYVNDALALMATMDRASGAEDLLYIFSNATLFELRQMPESTLVQYRLLAEADNPALADFGLYKLAVVSLQEGDTTGALEYVERLTETHAESYYLPFALKMKADVLVLSPETAGEAEDLYRRLLQDFPEYPFSSEVRQKMRRLGTEPAAS